MSEPAFRKGTGCQRCHDSGFKGRTGVYEVMEATAKIKSLIHQGASADLLQEALSRQGGLTLRQEGVKLALEGKTSLEEALSVTHSTGHVQDAVDEPEPVGAGSRETA
jgi:type II secretory ATPase GspE/PulE/Tfp pilus assembly ATPase PilB-like protein